MAGIISGTIPGSIADELEITAGSRLISINGESPGDIIDYDFFTAETLLEVEIEDPDGEIWLFEIEKEEDEPLGLVFEADVFDRIRGCANHCLFCFIDQLQPSPRPSLLVKDDDYRMSFLEGNFITTTNMSESDFQRIERMRLSPLYISVHTVDPVLRRKMLGVKRDVDIIPVLKRLIGMGVTIHAQIVLCPDINDGEYLQETLKELKALYPGVASCAVVPVGITKYQRNPLLRLFSPKEAGGVIDLIETYQKSCMSDFGDCFVFAADELYIKAERDFPPAWIYGEFPQLENGIGMASLFIQEWQEYRTRLPHSYTGPYTALVTGWNGLAVLRHAYADLSPLIRERVDLVMAPSLFYGETITATGLLTGSCIAAAIPRGKYQRVIIPDNMLKFSEDVFLDDMTVPELSQLLGAEIVVAPCGAKGLYDSLFG